MKYRLAEDCLGVSHGGVQLDVPADGTLDLDAFAARALAPHGIVAQPERAIGDNAKSGKRPVQPKPDGR